MKKISIIIVLLILALGLIACNGNTSYNSDESEFQVFADTSSLAKEYAENSLVERFKKQGIEGYTIEHTASGFITDETPIFIVAFKYTHDMKTEIYGYKISVDDSKQFKVIEEGKSVAYFILSD